MEFHAVILCGPGHALSPFSKTRSTGTPKALLRVANRPMIDYVLEWCEKAFFPRVTIVCDNESTDEMQGALSRYDTVSKQQKAADIENDVGVESSTNTAPVIDILPIDAASSGEVLHQLYKSKKLKSVSNFAILPCDFITDLPPQVLIEAYRNKNDSDLGLLVHYRNKLDIEDKKSKVFPKNYTIYSDLRDKQALLLDIYSSEDIDFQKALKLRVQMSWRYPYAIISTKLLNSSIFLGSVDKISKLFDQKPDKYTEAYFRSRPCTKIIRDIARGSWRHSEQRETVGLIILPHQASFFRINNLPVWMEANRYFMKLQAMSKGQSQLQTKDKASAIVGADSLIGEGTILGEKTNVKRTTIGLNCNIGKRVKLTGCLISNNVTIEDDVQLENCILGNSVIVRSKLRLTNCNVESNFEVVRGTQSKGDTLLCFSLEGIVKEEEDSSLESPLETEDDETSSDVSLEDEYDDEYGDNSDGLFAH